ncbi:MAG: HupE/UreJ family protein [Hyphomicrobiaceae bacterium]
MKTRTMLAGRAGAALIALSLAPAEALAHHAMDGKLPVTALQGFITGLAHPVVGLDHLAFVVAVGLAAALLGRLVALPLAFVGGTLAGCVVHLASVTLPATEIVIAATVVAMGLLVATGRTLPPAVLLAFTAAAGLFHGWAYGEGIFGAEQSPLGAYLAGFTLIQAAIAVGTALAARTLLASPAADRSFVRIAGAVVLGIGIAMLVGHVEAIAFPGLAK